MKNKLKRIGTALLFPYPAVMILLIPVCAVLLGLCLNFFGSENIISYIIFALSAYTFAIWCLRIPRLIQKFKHFKENNKYARRWFYDIHFRINILLYSSFAFNLAYALFQLCLGIYHSSFWYYSLAGYFIAIAFMRIFLFKHTKKHTVGENILIELKKYRICGFAFLFINLLLSVIILFMIEFNRSFIHHEITTITMATYTFTTLTVAIINIIKYKKYQSPVYSAAKTISLAAACVSMITLTSTMLTAFGGEEELSFRRLILALLGGGVSLLIISMALYMIITSTKKIKGFKNE